MDKLTSSQAVRYLASRNIHVKVARASRIIASLPHEWIDAPTRYRVVALADLSNWADGYPHKRGRKCATLQP